MAKNAVPNAISSAICSRTRPSFSLNEAGRASASPCRCFTEDMSQRDLMRSTNHAIEILDIVYVGWKHLARNLNYI